MASVSSLRSLTWKAMVGVKGNTAYVAAYRNRLISWRKQDAIVRLEKPTRIERARSLGFKENNKSIVVRVRVVKGNPYRLRPKAGRRPKRMGVKQWTYKLSDKKIAENRAQSKYSNMRVGGSYFVGEDGVYKWYEVILLRD
ncbi:MAG: 50S ribosomal protein L15 [Thermoprotei archaeon]